MPYSEAHKIQTKDRILKSATELFSRYGFDKVSISQIMKLARLTHGAFYSHFESKEALFNASFMDGIRRSRAARLVKHAFSIKHLTALVTDYLNLREQAPKDDPGPEAILFNEIGSQSLEIKKLYHEAYMSMKKVLETRITALGKLNGVSVTADSELVADNARAILASLVGAVAIARSLPDEEEQRRILEAAQKQILALLGVNEQVTGS